jgi:60 kDa SS-A/Ro ribonucleoprotein
MSYLRNILRPPTQREPLDGQVANSAGGYSYPVDDWVRLDRFLVLGSQGGSYYATQQALTRENANAALACIAENGARAVSRIVAISEAGRAPKNDPALFALALAATSDNRETRRAAFDALPRVARIGTHLLHFADYLNGLRGWGRGARAGLARWYIDQDAARLALQVVKYRQRDGWTHRDILRLTHPIASGVHADILHWIVKGWPDVGEAAHPDPVLRLIWAYERAQRAADVHEIVRLITEHQLPREAIPTQWLNERAVWEALLPHMPIEAMTRNLATMTRIGLIAPLSAAAQLVAERLGDAETIRRARLHPIKLLAALLTYQAGHGARGQHTWTPVPQIVDALDSAFYLAFDAIEPTHKRMVLALDVSGSMGMGKIAGVPGLSPRVGSAAMALVTAATERQHHIMAFSSQFVPLSISPRQRLDDALQIVSGLPFSGTDCALPMLWAIQHKIEADAFVIYTDSETWYGNVHPATALQRYRQAFGILAKLVVVGMMANSFTIADPNDTGMLDVVGFDTAAPAVMSDFIAERV